MLKFARWDEESLNFLKNNYGIIKADEIAKHLGISKNKVIHKAFRIGLKSNKAKFIQDNNEDKILKKVSSKFTIIEYSENTRPNILVKCPYCENAILAKPHTLVSGHTKSCGCIHGLKRRRGTKNISSTFWSRLIQHAKARGLDIEISIQDLEELLLKQNFKCALSGIPISVGYGSLKKSGEVTGSVDRIDNNKGYLKDNIQFVHKDINWMKQDFNQDIFLEYCYKIYRKHHKNE